MHEIDQRAEKIRVELHEPFTASVSNKQEDSKKA